MSLSAPETEVFNVKRDVECEAAYHPASRIEDVLQSTNNHAVFYPNCMLSTLFSRSFFSTLRPRSPILIVHYE